MRNSRKLRPETTESYLERVNRVIDHIHKHVDQPQHLGSLAKIAHLSPFHFHRVFQAIVGETPNDFVRRIRLQRALRMMSRTPRPSLTRIALDCGYSSSSEFSRTFRKTFGVSPARFDLADWQRTRADELHSLSGDEVRALNRIPGPSNPDRFRVHILCLPVRSVAYIRVARPYQGDGVIRAAERLQRWAATNGVLDHQWLGYQWENPDVTPLNQCSYHVAVEADSFLARGEIGRFQFPEMLMAEVRVCGGIEVELRALRWLYGVWLPRSGYIPDDFPCFEAWNGLPFASGYEHFDLRVQLPIRKT